MRRIFVPLGIALSMGGPPAIAAVTIADAGVGCVVVEQHPQLWARIEPLSDVSRARVYFRAGGTTPWYYVEMRAEAERFLGTLPKPKRGLKQIDYYVEATATDFQTSRTADYGPAVVDAAAGCVKGVKTASFVGQASIVVRGPAGAPAIPAGFSSAGVAAAAPAAVGTAVGAAGGASTALIVAGVLGGSAAVAGGVALATQQDDAAPASAGPASTGPSCLPLDVYEIDLRCGDIGRDVRAGCPITFQAGIGRWPTVAEAEAALAGRTATISVDGRPVEPVTYVGITLHTGAGAAPGYGNQARATWVATDGPHHVVGLWTGDMVPIGCDFTVAR